MSDVGIGLLYLGAGLVAVAVGVGAIAGVVFAIKIGRRVLRGFDEDSASNADARTRFKNQQARVDGALHRSSGRIV